jgi:hypothetical protein
MQVKEVWCPAIDSDISVQTELLHDPFGPAEGGI